MNIKVTNYKKAVNEDLSLIVKLDQAAFNREFDFAFQDEREAGIFLRECDVHLVFIDGKPIGYYAIKKEGRRLMEIVGVVIAPECQRKGIGTQIVKKILGEMGHGRVKVVAHPENIAALKLYLNFGFVISAYKEDYYGPGQPRVVLYRG